MSHVPHPVDALMVAQAAGLNPTSWNDGGEPYSSGPGVLLGGSGGIWRPWQDDGDCLRLCAALEITVAYERRSAWLEIKVVAYHGEQLLARHRRATTLPSTASVAQLAALREAVWLVALEKVLTIRKAAL